jgi:hypothetical protein
MESGNGLRRRTASTLKLMTRSGHHIIQKRDLLEMLQRLPDYAYVAVSFDVAGEDAPDRAYGEEKEAFEEAWVKVSKLHGLSAPGVMEVAELRSLCEQYRETCSLAEEMRKAMEDHVSNLEEVFEEKTGFSSMAFIDELLAPSDAGGTSVHRLRCVA